MKKLEKLNEESLAEVSHRLMHIRGAIEGIGGLCFTHGGEMPLETDEIHGLGLLFKMLNSELRQVERTISHMSDMNMRKRLKVKNKSNKNN